jgi:hypothetical protein
VRPEPDIYNRSEQIKVFRGSLLGTTCMTLFSYLFSLLEIENLKEPKLLGQMIYRKLPASGKRHSRIAGWVLHYVVGLLFAELYAQYWEKTGSYPTVKSGLMLGGLSGIAAILIWKITFDIQPRPPSVNFKHFAVNLLIAHLVFGLFMVVGYNAPPSTYLRKT